MIAFFKTINKSEFVCSLSVLCLFLMWCYTQNEMEPSIKYVRSGGGRGVESKAYISIQGAEGVSDKTYVRLSKKLYVFIEKKTLKFVYSVAQNWGLFLCH